MERIPILKLTASDIKSNIDLFRKMNWTNETFASYSLSNKEFERKTSLHFKSYTDNKGTEEFLTLTMQDEETIKKYCFLTTGAQLKQLAQVHNHFLQTGEVLHID